MTQFRNLRLKLQLLLVRFLRPTQLGLLILSNISDLNPRAEGGKNHVFLLLNDRSQLGSLNADHVELGRARRAFSTELFEALLVHLELGEDTRKTGFTRSLHAENRISAHSNAEEEGEGGRGKGRTRSSRASLRSDSILVMSLMRDSSAFERGLFLASSPSFALSSSSRLRSPVIKPKSIRNQPNKRRSKREEIGPPSASRSSNCRP